MRLDLGCIGRGRGEIKMRFLNRLDFGLGGLLGELMAFPLCNVERLEGSGE